MKSNEELLRDGEMLLAEFCQAVVKPEENRFNIEVSPGNLIRAIKILVDQQWGYLVTITGKDIPPVESEDPNLTSAGMIAGLYHFANQAAIITLQVKVPYDQPVIPSICGLIPSATIYEREFMELFGVKLEGTPDTTRLVLPDDWPEDVYPLRKSFTSLAKSIIAGKEVE